MAAPEFPPPLDLSHHLSRVTKARPASRIKEFYKYFAIPGIGQLAGGLPNDLYFPYDTLEAQVAVPNRWTDKQKGDASANETPSLLARLSLTGSSSSHGPPHSRVTVPHATPQDTELPRKIDLMSALQYGTAQGYPPLYNFLREFATKYQHPNVPYQPGPDIILTCGATDGFSKVIQAFNNEWVEGRDCIEEKEGLLCEEFAYMNAIQTARPRGMNIVPVTIDDGGMKVDGKGGLRDVLENWNVKRGRRPHLMYTVTIGQNPTSSCLSIPRRKAIYALCKQYDILIIEDDPYWYLQYPTTTSTSSAPSLDKTPVSTTGYPFLDSLIPSYLTIDTDGRVLRLDSFSKTMAPGCRMGWITAQPLFIERLQRITETSTQQPSGFVQSLVAELLVGPVDPKSGKAIVGRGQGWGMDGWVKWLEGLSGEYRSRMEEMCAVLEEGQSFVVARKEKDEKGWSTVRKVDYFTFPKPQGGMFIWLTFDFSSHPLSKAFPHATLSRALWLFWTTAPHLVLLSPGTIFAPSKEIEEESGWKHFRLCFAAVPREEVAPITKRLVGGVKAFWKIKDKEIIDKLLEPPPTGFEELKEGMAALTGFC